MASSTKSHITHETARFTFNDRRQSERLAVVLEGRVRVRHLGLVPCRVLNVSGGGALIEFDDPIGLPPEFSLIIESENFEAACEVRHKQAQIFGVMFVSNRREALTKFGSGRAVRQPSQPTEPQKKL